MSFDLQCKYYPATRIYDQEGGSVLIPDVANASTIYVDPTIQENEMVLSIPVETPVAIGDFIEIPHQSEAH